MAKRKNSTESVPRTAGKKNPSTKTRGGSPSTTRSDRSAAKSARPKVAVSVSKPAGKKDSGSKKSVDKAVEKSPAGRSPKASKSEKLSVPAPKPQAKPVSRTAKSGVHAFNKILATSELAAKARAVAAGIPNSSPKRSGKGSARLARGARADVSATDEALDNDPLVLRKTHLTPKELEEFRDVLLEKRRELVGDMANLQGDALGAGGSSETTSSSMPIHLAELGSDTWEQEFTLGLIEKERSVLREIDEALDRIDSKTYGICLMTGKPISKTRLRAKPWAKYCIEYARKQELGLA